MMKAQYCILAVALITGTALGLLDVFHFGKEAEPSAVDSEMLFRSQSAPFFGKSPVKKDITEISLTRANLSMFISLYAEMSAAELIAEIKRLGELSKKGKRINDDVNFLISYIAFKLGRDFPGDIRTLFDNGLVDSGEIATPLFQGWARNDFDGAMEYLLKNKGKWQYDTTVNIFASLLHKRTEDYPDKSIEWVLSQKGRVRQSALFEMLGVLSEKHPLKMQDLVTKLLPDDLEDMGMLACISEKWGSCDWESALRWADTMSGKKKKEAIVEILNGLCLVDLEKATEEFKKQPDEIQGSIAKVIVRSLSSRVNPEGSLKEPIDNGKKQALEWVLSHRQAGDDTKELVRDIFFYSEKLTPEFTDYVQKLPDGAVKDNALDYMVYEAMDMAENGNYTYEQVLALSMQIKDAEVKESSIEHSMRNWIKNDPESASFWIEEKSEFSSEEKQRYLDACEKLIRSKME